jgi:cytochrome c peroxidase
MNVRELLRGVGKMNSLYFSEMLMERSLHSGDGRDRRYRPIRIITTLVLVLVGSAPPGRAVELSPMENLGKQLFFDTNLSNPPGQSCASCHAPETGFTGPDSEINRITGVYPRAAKGRFGNRKPPSAAYASFSPARSYREKDKTWVGGQFWDGRADDLMTQAKGPLLNPLEMNNASAIDVVNKIRSADYRPLFERVFGRNALDKSQNDRPFDQIAQAIAAYESSLEVNAFSSKYDAYLAELVSLTPQEARGLKLFAGQANCAACHPHQPQPDGSPPLFTDFTYDNVGAPRNEGNPFYDAESSVNPDGKRYRDLGLGGILKDTSHAGKFKVPTLRNVAKKPYPGFVKSYLHNGAFKSLKEVVHFYNVRGKELDEFPPPDVKETVNLTELGNLGLSNSDEDDLVAFLETLSDGWAAVSTPQKSVRNSFRGVRDVLRVEQYRYRVIQASGIKGTERR